MTGVYLGDAAGDFVYLLPGLACGIAWDTRYIRFAPSGDTGISYFPVILCAVRKRLCKKDYIISLNLPQMGIRKQRYMIIYDDCDHRESVLSGIITAGYMKVLDEEGNRDKEEK